MTDLPPENVQSYPRPPALEPVPQALRVVFAGETLAETTRALRVLETHHAPTYYIPVSDIRSDALQDSRHASFCEWKGRARYHDIVLQGRTVRNAAWTYPSPSPRFAALRDHLAIYAEPMDACYVGETRVTPQPGNFYGGWVTPNLTGRIKGAPGTEGW